MAKSSRSTTGRQKPSASAAKRAAASAKKAKAPKASAAEAVAEPPARSEGAGSEAPAEARPSRPRRRSRRRVKVGFLGQGRMGVPMALALLEAGFAVRVWNRHPDKAREAVEAGAAGAETPAEAARGADVVVVMVADDAAFDTVLFGENGASRGLKRGAVLVNCSTTSPAIAYRAATALRSLGVRYLEAPVMRGAMEAREGRLQILVGGAPEDVEKARKVLDALGADIHHVGEIGKASTLKLACNLLLACLSGAFAEAFLLVRKSGIPFETMMQVLHAGPLDSKALRDAEQIVVNPGGRPNYYLSHMLNDLDVALEVARQLSLPVPLTATTRQVLVAAHNLGMGEKDFGSIVELLSKWGGVAMRG